MIFVINFAFIPLIAAAIGLEYLRRALQPPAAPTNPVAAPFTPPFEGGQCVGSQYSHEWVASDGNPTAISGGSNSLFGKIQSIGTPYQSGLSWLVNVADGNGNRTVAISGLDVFNSPAPPTFSRLIVTSGSDDCGNLPNPNEAPPIASDGVADSAAPDLSSDLLVATGGALVPIAPIAAAIAALLSAVQAAASALEAIKKVAEMIKEIADLLKDLIDFLKDIFKKEKEKKDVALHNYGSLVQDGFLRLYPSTPPDGFEPEYLDLQLLSIPIGYGKYFGNKSPNFYRFKSLGYISFVSPSFGILSTHQLEYGRISLNIPENCLGFFYHLGLDGIIKANVTLFYSKNKSEEEE